jgi:choline-sulfatase
MTRRQALQFAAAGLVGHPTVAQQQPFAGKNVVLIMSDQHKKDCLGAAGDSVARTPNLDALAASGVRFSNAYCSNPVCTPSRASLLTGLYTHNHQSLNNQVPLPMEHKTMAHYFARAGYATALVGKMHFVDAQTHGFDYKVDFNDWFQYLGPKTKLYAEELSRANSGSGMPEVDDFWRDSGDPWKNDRERDGREGSVAVGRISKIPEADHFESFIARESVRFLRKYGARKQPFLLVTSFLKPHDPFMPAERFAKQFRAEDMQLPDTFGKVDLNTIPAVVRNTIQHNAPTPELRDRAEAKKRIALYYANLAQMDDCAGTVLNALRETGLDKNTVVIYTSDHGEMLGEHGMWQKFEFYESSCGVPLIIRDPSVAKPGVCKMPVSQVSLLPTIADMCRVPLPKLDAPGFRAQVMNPATTDNRPVFAEYDLGKPQAKYMLRDGDLKYTFWTHDIAELYDLRTDPKEMNNLALKQEHAETLARMKAKLFAWYQPPELNLQPH